MESIFKLNLTSVLIVEQRWGRERIMKIVIDIPDEDYKFIKDLRFYNSGRRSGKTIEQNVINVIKKGTPIKTVTNAEEAEAYLINQEDKSRILRNIANTEDFDKGGRE